MKTVTVTSKQYWPNESIRYRLSNGWFMDKDPHTCHRHYGYLYSLWEPGASESGGAAWRGGGNTLKVTLAQIASR